jgi:carbamoyl-phosphate synthase large subunit
MNPRLLGRGPDDEIRITDKQKVIILGGGPNRIGQGIEFDYCCCHAAFAAKELGFESVMINSNPETVSTDYDTSDILFFEPLTLEDVLNITERLHGKTLAGEGNVHGLIVQFGGQTPLNLAHGLQQAGAPIIGTSVDSIDLAEDRDRFDALLEKLKISRPAFGHCAISRRCHRHRGRIGYPILVRPSYVLGGRGMEVCFDEPTLRNYVTNALKLSGMDDAPVLIDRFLDAATEVDVDVVADYGRQNSRALIAGVMEHIEQAGIHSGDSSCTIPPYSLPKRIQQRVRQICRDLAISLRVCGLMNVQLAIKDEDIYILEVNPRASRTVPFVAKATHTPWPAIAAKVMMGKSLAELGAVETPEKYDGAGPYAVKESVFPFSKFPGVDVVLGPEMRSTGEVMGIDISFPVAFAKAQMSAGSALPREGGVFLSVREADRATMVDVARSLLAMGFTVYATEGTGGFLQRHGLRLNLLAKIGAGARPNVLDHMANGEIKLVINTPTRTGWKTDEGRMRSTAVRLGIPMITTATAAQASVKAIEALRAGDWDVASLQDYAGEDEARPKVTIPRPVPARS